MTNGAATTTITYVGASEELSTTAGVTTTTTSYTAGGKRLAQATNGAFSYLGSDGLGSAEVALDGSGNPQASVLYDPYGNVRYSSGTMPGSYGYTGQRADAATGLDYYGARYYDAVAGQFVSADSVAAGGLNRYGYVAGNPETLTDPTGHRYCTSDGSSCSRHVGGGTADPSPTPCDTCNYDDDHIHIRPNGDPDCPAPGCAKGHPNGAFVGPGKKVHGATSTDPVEYEWGDSSNGAYAEGYYGASLAHLIAGYKGNISDLKSLVNFIDDYSGVVGFVSGALVFVVTGLLTKNAALASTLGGWAGIIASAGVEVWAGILRSDIDSLTNTMHALQSVYNAGETAWYVQGIWAGNDSRYSMDAGGPTFLVSHGTRVPFAVYYQVGYDMWQQCADAPATQWGSSPGIPDPTGGVC